MRIKVRKDQLVALVLLGLMIAFYESINREKIDEILAGVQPLQLEFPLSVRVPVMVASDSSQLADLTSVLQASAPSLSSDLLDQITAEATYVYDIDSGSILLDENSSVRLAPASTTKLLTALVAFDIYTPETVLTVTADDIVDSNRLLFYVGEELTVENLMKAMLIESSNTAAQVLASNHPQSTVGFIQAMNNKTTKLGLADSKFQNAVGFDHPEQWSTARDLSILARRAMEHPDLKKIVGTDQSLVSDFLGKTQHQLQSTNQLLGDKYEVVGVKTGTTEQAGEVLISQFETGGKSIQIVVMGSEDRYADTLKLIDWTLKNYEWRPLADILER